MLKDKYDLVVLSRGLSSMFSASYCASKGIDTLLISTVDDTIINAEGVELFPYELPVFAVGCDDYLGDFFSYIGLKGLRDIFLETAQPITIINGKHRFDYYLPCIKEEIQREFPKYKNNILNFIDEIRIINSKFPPLWVNESSFPYQDFSGKLRMFRRFPKVVNPFLNKSIEHFYKKHKLPEHLCLMFNSLIYVFSGVKSNKYPVVPSIRILSELLNGVYVNKPNVLSVRSEILKMIPSVLTLKKNTDVTNIKRIGNEYKVRLNSYEGVVKSDSLITDFNSNDIESLLGLKNVPLQKQQYNGWHPYTLYAKIKKGFIHSHFSRMIIYINSNKSLWFDFDDIYIVRIESMESGEEVVGVTSFMPSEYFKQSKDTFLEKSKQLYKVLEDIFPHISVGCEKLYPNLNGKNFEDELFNLLSVVPYRASHIDYEKNFNFSKFNVEDIRISGRTVLPWLGFEGLMISGLKASDSIFKQREQ